MAQQKLQETKETIRKRVLSLLRNQKEEDRIAKSSRIGDKLFNLRNFKHATTILFYMSFDGEVDTFEMIRQAKEMGKIIGLPRINKKEKEIIPAVIERIDNTCLEMGSYGILQPRGQTDNLLDIDKLDMVIVPGIAFDRQNNRLGRGKGYYDRFLKKISSHTITVGLAFDFQIVEHLPQLEHHDVPVSCVLVN